MLWMFLLAIFAAGAVGGIVNALLTDNGFLLPNNMGNIWRPGCLSNIFIGGIAAAISWGLYGPFAAQVMLGGDSSAGNGIPGLTLSALVGAILIGIGGARWLTNEVDQKLLRASGSEMAKMHSDPAMAQMFATSSPADVRSATMKAAASDKGTSESTNP